MTSPARGGPDTAGMREVPDPRFRDQLAEALPESLGPVGLRRRAIPALGVEASVTGYGLVLLDALMPTIAAEVEARVQAAANQRAVEVDVDRAARAMHEIPAQPGVYGRIPWERLMEQHREAYRQMARAALAAAAEPTDGRTGE